MINNKSILSASIPIPKSPEKIQYWVDKISAPFNEKSEKQILLETLEREVFDRVKFISENEECVKKEVKAIYNVIYGDKTETIIDENSLFKQVGGGSNMSNLKLSNKWNTIKNTIIVARSGSPGNVNIFNENTFVGSFAFTLNIKEGVKTNNFYNYYFLKSNQESITDMAEGSVQKNLNREKLNSFKISIPKNKKIIKELETKFAQIEQLKIDIQKAEVVFEQYIEELGNEAIKR
jgi:restriction endonuclease S subunit